MDRKTILNEGLLEQYILGELSPDICIQLESLIDTDKELKSLYDQLELDFENLGLDNAIPVPIDLKTSILEEIKSTQTASKVISIDSKPKSTFKGFFRIAAALAAFFMLSTFYLLQQQQTLNEELKIVKASSTEKEDESNSLNSELRDTKSLLAFLSDTDTEQYILEGNELMPEAKLLSYVNHKEKKVIVNTKNLPPLDANEDYQMWADVKGEMINMGVIPKSSTMSTLAYIEDAESLNVTIEPSGGSDHPTVTRLITNTYLR